VCVDRVGAFDDLRARGFSAFYNPPSSGTSGVAHDPRSSMPDSTSTCLPTRMISALEASSGESGPRIVEIAT
jgi:hypothetical protein